MWASELLIGQHALVGLIARLGARGTAAHGQDGVPGVCCSSYAAPPTAHGGALTLLSGALPMLCVLQASLEGGEQMG